MDKQHDTQHIGKALCAIDGTYWHISKLSEVKENLFWLLYALDDGEFHTQKQICDDWLFPKTTINTLIKECESAGYITLQAIPGRKRELQICLTEKGREYARQVLKPVCEIERMAVSKVMENCSPTFAADLERFAAELQAAYEYYRQSERS